MQLTSGCSSSRRRAEESTSTAVWSRGYYSIFFELGIDVNYADSTLYIITMMHVRQINTASMVQTYILCYAIYRLS
jgi:hypothetical protein